MQAIHANLLLFLRQSPQFVIPIYQRNYSWTAIQCQKLWDDLLRAGRNEAITSHFMGTIVYIQGPGNVVRQAPLLVIDGQQRLTTGTLLIAALAQHFEKNNVGELLETFSARRLRNYYLLNPDEDGERHFKLILSETDKYTLLALLKNTPPPTQASNRVTENYQLFCQLIEKHSHELEAICRGLSKLMIVDVSLDRTQDNPQLIFESMNSTGLELSQADLIRNYILMRLEPTLQTELYQTYWRPMERAFGQAAYVVHFDAFMRYYLTAKTGVLPNVREVYAAFKDFAQTHQGDTRALVADLHAYASYYCAMALGTETNPALKDAFHDLRELKVDVAYPFLLDVYHDYRQQRLSSNELLCIVRLVESYVFRRAICAMPTNSLNRIFAGLSRTLRKDRYLESVQATFLLLPSYRGFPKDDEFERNMKTRDLYNFRNRNYWLRRLENHARQERVTISDYTVEHILPQNPTLSPEWQIELGSDWQQIQQTWLHTLGNLTLTGYNGQYSDRPFAYKRDQVEDRDGNRIGFVHSPLYLNQGLGHVATWNEVAIKARADRLAARAINVWSAPQLAADVLDAYRPAAAQPGQPYSIANHPHLVQGAMQPIFGALRNAVLTLDPCVKEEFLMRYVAYKAETNFVDVVPQAGRLLLSLNMPFHELDDPRNLCRDVTNIGCWGNGAVEIGLSTLADLPYVMGLIRQAFERQMDGTQDE